MAYREREIKNMRKVHQAFERREEIFDVIFPIMKEHRYQVFVQVELAIQVVISGRREAGPYPAAVEGARALVPEGWPEDLSAFELRPNNLDLAEGDTERASWLPVRITA